MNSEDSFKVGYVRRLLKCYALGGVFLVLYQVALMIAQETRQSVLAGSLF